jgi:hypothetical protein
MIPEHQASARKEKAMSCWVVPAVAAAYWGVATDEVLRRVEQGEVVSKREMGFLLVDVAPDQPNRTFGRLPPEQRPPTWRPADDLPPTDIHRRRIDAERHMRISEATAEGDWRRSRQLVRQIRLAPRARAA